MSADQDYDDDASDAARMANGDMSPLTRVEPSVDESKRKARRMKEFRLELATLLNKHSIESGSGTPDFILAGFLIQCLHAYETGVRTRNTWHGGADESSFIGHTDSHGGDPRVR